MSLHRCTEAECPFLGKFTTRSCGCHKTDEQVLMEALRAALVEIESEPRCCGHGQPVEYHGQLVQECCGSPEYGFERAAEIIRSTLALAKP